MRWEDQLLSDTPDDLVQRAISIMASRPEIDDAMIAELRTVAGDDMLARRLIAWIPEALGHVYLARRGLDPVPATFGVRDALGNPRELPVDAEPLYRQITRMATDLPALHVENLAHRSSAFSAVDALISDGGDISDAVLSGPALISIPAEIYGKPKGLLRRLFGALG